MQGLINFLAYLLYTAFYDSSCFRWFSEHVAVTRVIIIIIIIIIE